jgi:hypothetical protein
VNINTTKKGPNGKQSKDLMPKFKLKPLGRKGGPKRKHKNFESHLEREPNKLKNVFDAKRCHIGKIRLHNRNMEHCKEPHPYPQRIMIHQKGHKMLKKSNQNKNLEEAQELKK